MPTYAAIAINQTTIIELFAHAGDVPDGKSRLAWALFRFPYDSEDQFFFIGGNYLGRNQPDYVKQIISLSQLNTWFEFDPAVLEPRKNRPRNEGSWFTITTRDGINFREKQSEAGSVPYLYLRYEPVAQQ